ncbi:hypothetical protein [Corynebacterium sp. HMSC055D05]|uniref:hypothetical protein n=1 Tax=Corynebacterium sp. HMSC055D05 TaxID=1715213 RepID=UPI00114D04A6|nr:hypothetical protein [Corynebacterium sp. HMSC055D05]
MLDQSNYTEWQSPQVLYGSVEKFLSSEHYGNGIHTICLGKSHLDVLLRYRPYGHVLVVFGGAVDRRKGVPPYFSGVGLSEKIPVSLISISDPAFTVDPDIRIGWYTGISSEPIQELTSQIIDAVLARWRKKKAVLLGGSAGGFAALAAAPRLVHKAEAVVMNPQTDIEQYHHKHSVAEWRRVCGENPQQVTNLANYYASFDSKPAITYFQNLSDVHLETHARPFLTSLNHDVEVIEGSWGEGHVPPPPETIAACLVPKLLPEKVGLFVKYLPIEKLFWVTNGK